MFRPHRTNPRHLIPATTGRVVARRRVVGLAVLGLMPMLPVVLIAAPGQTAGANALVEFPSPMPNIVEAKPGEPSPLVVDTRHNLGFAIGRRAGTQEADNKLAIYDLKRMSPVALFPSQGDLGVQALDVYRFAIDERRPIAPGGQARGRLIGPKGSPGLNTDPCEATRGTTLRVFTYEQATETAWTVQAGDLKIPCSGIYQFAARTASIYSTPTSTKLLLAGTYKTEGWRASLPEVPDNLGQPLILRQLDLDKIDAGNWADSLDWEIDLRYARCGRWDPTVPVLVERVSDDVLTYCWDTQPVVRSAGAQGYAVRIPMDSKDRPLTIKGAPALPDPANPSSVLPGVPAPTHRFDVGKWVTACQAAGFTGNAPGCAEAIANTATGQANQTANENVAQVPLPDATDPADPSSPTSSRFISNPVVRRTPTLPGFVFPLVDPLSKKLLLLTADGINGNAVWVFDPKAERFVGLITGGVVGEDAEKTAAGFDRVRGRAYVLTSSGILSASVRQSPLPGGKVHKVVDDADQVTPSKTIAVAPSLHRLFIPISRSGDNDAKIGYAVVEDEVADPPIPRSLDPDTFTRQIDEESGKTSVDRSGAAQASGAHILVTGGVPRAVNQVDPFCEAPTGALDPAAFERDNFNDSCFADLVVSKGNREYSLAYAAADTGTATGASAEGSGFFVPLTERPTDADIKNAGACLGRTFRGLGASGSDLGGYDQFCGNVQKGLAPVIGDDLRQGTQGGQYPDTNNDGKVDEQDEPVQSGGGFPVPSAICNDFGGRPASVTAPTDTKAQAFTATVTCNAELTAVAGQADVMRAPLPSALGVSVTVGHLSSSIQSQATPEGQLTVATATAEDVTIGPLHIGSIRSTATSWARGRTGTAGVSVKREWCGVMLGDQGTASACVDPTTDPQIIALIDDLNQALGKVRLSVPDATASATPGGYQAVVSKHPEVVAADRAVNEDDSLTVSGLQIVVFNDGAEGRDRFIIQLAGVRTESRYAVVALPAFEIPEFPELELIDDPIVEALELAAAEPPRFETLPAIPASFESPAPSILGRVLPAPLQALRNLFGWLRNNLTEAALLFLFLAILATPVYLFLRRRAFERAMAS